MAESKSAVDYIKGGWGIVQPNLVPSIVAVIAGGIPILGCVVICNYYAQALKAKREGTPIDMGALFNFDNAVNQIVGPLVVFILVMLGSIVVVGGILVAAATFYYLPLIADNPGQSWSDLLKRSIEQGKANLVPNLILSLIMGLIVGIGSAVTCGLGALVLVPALFCGHALAYEDHKDQIPATA